MKQPNLSKYKMKKVRLFFLCAAILREKKIYFSKWPFLNSRLGVNSLIAYFVAQSASAKIREFRYFMVAWT